MSLPPDIAAIRLRPGMYLPSMSYDTAASFMAGYDAALRGGMLVGFREWLIVEVQDGNNLTWSALVLQLAKKCSIAKEDQAPDDRVTIEFMFETIERFMTEREQPDGLRKIYTKYEAWLGKQDWYTP